MQFNTYIFILIFMPVMVIMYFLGNKLNNNVGKAVLIIGSTFFYAYSDASTLLVLGLSLAANYLFSCLIRKAKKWRKLFMAVPVLINVGLLLYFKYTNFMIFNMNQWFKMEIPLKEIILPVGISFFTFQQIAYVVSVFRNEIENPNVIDYLVYILYFPKLLMGPLIEPVDFFSQLGDQSLKKVNWDNVAFGVKIFCFGLFKKVIIADTFAAAVTWGYSHMGKATSMDWLLIMLFYTFEIYFDFSGYSDMAVGTSLMLNLTLPMNFDSPYKAESIRDFWKRWHITLTKFLTKYVYIPLGGSRKGKLFTYLNTMIVFFVSGIWHGANWTFILWGVLHGLLMVYDRVFEKFRSKIFEPVRWVCTFGVVNILWLLFRSESIGQWLTILNTMLFAKDIKISGGLLKVFALKEGTFICNTVPFMNFLVSNVNGFWMLFFILASLGICLLPENNYKTMRKNNVITMIFAAIAFIWSFICLSGESVFVYFNF